MALLFEELPTLFPFYDAKEKQVRFNVNTDEPCGAYLITPKDALLPFQVRKTQTSEPPTIIEIVRAEDDVVVTDNTNLGTFLKTITLDGYDYLTYLGNRVFDLTAANWLDLPYGFYYVRMEFPNGEELFSEVFKVPLERFSITTPASIPFLKLEWSNSDGDIAPIHYNATEADRLVQAVYLDSNLSHTEPEVQREGITNGDGDLIPTWQKVMIRYNMKDVVPDFVKLALATIPIHDNIVLTLENNKRSGQIVNVEVESKPEANGYFSEVEINFEQDLALIKTGCESNMDPGECPPVPSNGTLGITAVGTAGGITVEANLPTGFFADIYSSPYNTTGFLSQANVYKSQLATAGSGVEVPFSALFGEYISLRLKTFNCISGYTTPIITVPSLPYHPRAMWFFQVIESDPDFIAAGVPLTTLEKDALNQLIIDCVNANVWGFINALWPFLGSGQHSQKYNLMNPGNTDAAHRLTFPNGATFSANGAGLASGSFQYADTHFSQQNKFPSVVGASMFLQIQTANSTGARGLMGAYNNAFSRMSMEVVAGGPDFQGWAYDTASGGLPFPIGASTQEAIFAISRRTLSDASGYYNGFPDITNPTPSGGSTPNADIYIGAINGQLGLGYLNGIVSGAAMAEGLTNTQVADLTSALANYNNNLGR